MPFSIRSFPVTYNAGQFIKRSLAYFFGFWSLITLMVLSSGPAYSEWVALGKATQTRLYMLIETPGFPRENW